MHTSEQLRERLAHVPAPSLVGIGDNVLDCYLHEDLAYPGGNALNVAAYSRLFFAGTAGFIGIMGDDRFAAHLGRVLDEVGVDRSRVRVAHGANGMAFVALDDEGDRRFVGSNRGGVQHELRLRINEQDHEYIAGFARMHTSVYSSMNSELGAVAERGTLISYDYSDDARPADVTESAPHVEVAFFSGGALNDAGRDDLAAFALGQGARIVVVTRGAHGATAYERGARISAGVKGVAAVDALGAGDAFITGFLAARAAGSDIDECLDVAATTGALACTLRGAFGYPVEAGEDARRQLVKRHVTAATPVSPEEVTVVRSSAALHEQVRATLAQEIADGVYDETGKIPAEPELCERFGVSRITVRRAVSDLEAMGTVRRRQGTGTFVTKRDNAISVMTIGGFADTYASRTDHMTRQVKRAEVTTADAETAAALHVEPGAPVFALERVFLLDGVPISIDRSAYSLDRFPDFDKRVDAETSTYRVLREEYGVEFAEVRRDLRIGFTTPESAEWLQRPANEPLLVTDKVALDRDGQVIHTSRIEYPPSRVALRTVAYADHPPEQPQS